ncbi:tail fiber protein [Acetobacteraceae bacterium]|nr:tail fiber protein [Acetobacteraceae bacterium]
MKLTDRQQQFPIPWANTPESGTFSSIPKEDPGDGSASLSKGFPKATMLPVAAGGKPPRGDQFNGIFNQLSLCAQNNDVGVIPPWCADFAQEIGGYPLTSKITTVQNNIPDILISLCDNNLDNPNDPNQKNWVSIKNGLALSSDLNAYQPKGDYAPLSAGVPIGFIGMCPSYAPPEGWLNLDGSTFDQETYPELFGYLGTNKLQDWRGRFPRGPKGSTIAVPEIGTQQGDAIRNISGGINGVIAGSASASDAFFAWQNVWGATSGTDGNAFVSYNFDASRVVPTDIENRPYAIVSNFIIKAK